MRANKSLRTRNHPGKCFRARGSEGEGTAMSNTMLREAGKAIRDVESPEWGKKEKGCFLKRGAIG